MACGSGEERAEEQAIKNSCFSTGGPSKAQKQRARDVVPVHVNVVAAKVERDERLEEDRELRVRCGQEA